jgi:hypothetical protein
VAVEHREVLVGGRELVHRDRHLIVRGLEARLFVQVVADAGPMRQQVLYRHVVADERQVLA